ncbi:MULTISPECIES: hypothetical protein [Bacillus]|uniref:hypothetical protein n=1 Tax=Bacillus TaxID=1386 RepID=UPI000F768A2F|nr:MULTISPECIES: hypothetical protein [Bacillus]MDJ0288211.1 hypothetical protein [Bacillus altitudinis]
MSTRNIHQYTKHTIQAERKNVGNVYQRKSGEPTQETQEPQEIASNMGNVGESPREENENEDDEDLII